MHLSTGLSQNSVPSAGLGDSGARGPGHGLWPFPTLLSLQVHSRARDVGGGEPAPSSATPVSLSQVLTCSRADSASSLQQPGLGPGLPFLEEPAGDKVVTPTPPIQADDGPNPPLSQPGLGHSVGEGHSC